MHLCRHSCVSKISEISSINGLFSKVLLAFLFVSLFVLPLIKLYQFLIKPFQVPLLEELKTFPFLVVVVGSLVLFDCF